MNRFITGAATLLTHLAFWSWNLSYAAFVASLGYREGPGLIKDLFRGWIPWDFSLILACFLVWPFVGLAVGVLLARDAFRLRRFFVGVQLPLSFTAFLRLVLLHELTPPVAHLFALLALGGALLTLQVIRPRTRPLSAIGLAVHAVLLLVAVWPAVVVGVFVPPGIVLFVEQTLDGSWWRGGFRGALGALESLFFTLSWLLLLLGPILFFSAYVGTFISLARTTAAAGGARRAVVATVAGLAAYLLPVPILAPQPQVAAFAALEGDIDPGALLGQETQIRAGLLNAYLAPQRYPFARGGQRWVVQAWRDMPVGGEVAQWIFDRAVTPLTFDGEDLGRAPSAAALLYQNVFDRPIQDGERDAILASLTATWERSGVEAGLLDVSGEKVHLERQEIHVSQKGGIATVQIDEVYRNRTWDTLELFYAFSLPESAAVTGLWLSDDPADPTRYPGVVAPRGAAQQVYLEQRPSRADPALLEQVGPRQYRLRVFPVPARSRENDVAPPVSMRFTYQVLVTPEGVPLPALLQRRNVYWDGDTERVGSEAAGDDWFAASVGPGVAPTVHTSGTVTARPASPTRTQGRYAVLVDGSLSMRDHDADVRAALGALPGAEVWLIPGWHGGPARRVDTLPERPWFGVLSAHDLLETWGKVRGTGRFDAVFVLTDDGGYDVTARDTATPLPADLGGPVWMVHLGGAFAAAYDDATLDAIAGVAGSVDEARAGQSGVVDGHQFTVGDADAPVDPAFAPIAARLLAGQVGKDDPAAAHGIAVAAGVVTPYSSLIALVDDAQRARLAALSAQDDAFAREVETGVEALPGDVTAVPEPEEWLLIVLSVGLLAVVWRRRRAGQSAAPRTP